MRLPFITSTIVPLALAVVALGCGGGSTGGDKGTGGDATVVPDTGEQTTGGETTGGETTGGETTGEETTGGETTGGETTGGETTGCTPACEGMVCGPDGCDGSCGECADGETCTAEGQCAPDCVPQCEGKVCGPDGCEGSCGDCADGETCTDDGQCAPDCAPQCEGKACGPDGCEGSCGDCADGESCDDAGQCVLDCVPQCEGKVCGDNGCDGTCGKCADGETCDDAGQCEPGCVPQCEGKACGDDGCEGTCGECSGGETCAAGQCVAGSGDGDLCASAIAVDALPYSNMANNTGVGDDYQTAGCGGLEKGAGTGDLVYLFTPAVTGVYAIGLAPDPTTPMPGMVFVVTDCADIPGACVDASGDLYGGGEYPFKLEAGTTYYIIVDGWFSSDEGPFELTIGEPCLPSCADKACGDDGCGSSCGTCGESELCNEQGQCEDASAVEGNTCANPFTIDAVPPTAVAGDTSNATPQLSVGEDVCEGESGPLGEASADHVYGFVPADTGVYTLSLEAEFDSLLYVATDCTDIGATCLGASDTVGTEELVLFLEAATQYWIIVDGWSNSSNTNGVYKLTIGEPCIPSCEDKECGGDGCGGDCGAACVDGLVCDPSGICVDQADLTGNTCDSPILVDTIPATLEGDTSQATGNFSTSQDVCPGVFSAKGSASNDNVYEFIAPHDGGYTITLDPSFDAGLFVFTDCADIDNTCLAGSEVIGEEEVAVTLEAGQTVYILVDGYSNSTNLNGKYTLNIADCVPQCEAGVECGPDACGGSCGDCGDDAYCSETTCITKPLCEPLEDTLLSCDMSLSGLSNGMEGSTNVFTDYACSTDTYDGSPEIALELLVDEDAHVTVKEIDGASIEVIFLKDEGVGCGWTAEGCVAYGYTEATFFAKPEDVHYVLFDSYNGSTVEDFGVEVTCCFPSCEDKECGGDGCGGSCGEGCAEGDLCSLESVCVPASDLVGNVCENPAVIDAVPFQQLGDTTQGTADFQVAGDQCEGMSSAKGDASTDHVFEFTPDAGDLYKIAIVDNGFDAALYVGTDCADVGGTCLAGTDTGGGEELYLTLEADTTYYIVVDGYSTSTNLAGEYTLTVDVCVPQCEIGACGDDGCGGDCGDCVDPEFCASNVCVAGDTCENRCGDFNSNAACQCDSVCFSIGDCCDDICDFCSADYPAGCGP